MAQLSISGSGSLTEVKILARIIVTHRLTRGFAFKMAYSQGWQVDVHGCGRVQFLSTWVTPHESLSIFATCQQGFARISNPRKRARRKLSFLWLILGKHKVSLLHILSIRRESLSPAYIHKEFLLQYLLWTRKFQHILTWPHVSFSLEYINKII